MKKYAKAIVAVAGAVLATVATIYGDRLEWLPIAITFVTALGVYAVPNIPE